MDFANSPDGNHEVSLATHPQQIPAAGTETPRFLVLLSQRPTTGSNLTEHQAMKQKGYRGSGAKFSEIRVTPRSGGHAKRPSIHARRCAVLFVDGLFFSKIPSFLRRFLIFRCVRITNGTSGKKNNEGARANLGEKPLR